MPQSCQETNGKRRLWLWVTRPEYYLDEDGEDAHRLDPGPRGRDLRNVGQGRGWWTCDDETSNGDLILMYRTEPKRDIAYLLVATSRPRAAKEVPSSGWRRECRYAPIWKFSNPLSIQAMRMDAALREWSPLKACFRRSVFEIANADWNHLMVRFARQNKSFEMYLRKVLTPYLGGPVEAEIPGVLDTTGSEGEVTRKLVAHYKRERALRDKKIAATLALKGLLRCEVPGCGFDFAEKYGSLGERFAIVHHLKPLSWAGKPQKVRLSDLAVVCANCHAMIHRKNRCRPLKSLVAKK